MIEQQPSVSQTIYYEANITHTKTQSNAMPPQCELAPEETEQITALPEIQNKSKARI